MSDAETLFTREHILGWLTEEIAKAEGNLLYREVPEVTETDQTAQVDLRSRVHALRQVRSLLER